MIFKKKKNRMERLDKEELDSKLNQYNDFIPSKEANGLSREDIAFITDELNTKRAGMVLDAFSSDTEEERKEAFNNLVDVLENSTDFKDFPTYQNHEVALAATNDIAGLGIFGRLCIAEPDMNDMGWDGFHLSLESKGRKYNYHGKDKNGEDLIIDEDVDRFIQLVASSIKKSFNEANPIFNGFIKNMRVSAVHSSLTPTHKTVMSIRITRASLALNEDNFFGFATTGMKKVLSDFIKSYMNMMLGGPTGTGKTEAQKFLLSFVRYEDRIIMIEDVAETHLHKIFPDKDIMSLLTRTNDAIAQGSEKLTEVTIDDEVKTSLRLKPTWLVVAEVRGKEAVPMLKTASSGHNVITTLHVKDNKEMPDRFAGMMQEGIKNLDKESAKAEFRDCIHLGLHISRKTIDGNIIRYLDELSAFTQPCEEYPDGVIPIYKAKVHNDMTRTCKTFKMPDFIVEQLKDELEYTDPIQKYKEEENLDFTGQGKDFTEDLSVLYDKD